ncbi:MAG: hypothetical protein ACR2QK_09900 [Acidimicrobiales bacterium]
MTIEKGEAWGVPATDPSPRLIAEDDAELAAMAAEVMAAGSTAVARVRSGDILTTLGLSDVRPEDERFSYSLDLGMAYLGADPESTDPQPAPFVAHLIAGPSPRSPSASIGRLLGHGPPISLAVMNGAWMGDLRLGPRAHPNDGLLDVTEGRVRFQDRREAAIRARTGSHLPHPALRTKRVGEWKTEFDRPTSVRLDGVEKGRFRSVRVVVIPDSLTVVA